MGLKEDIKSLLAKENYTLTSIVKILNEKNNKDTSVQNLSTRLTNNTLRYSEVVDILESLNYHIEWVKDDEKK